MDFAYIRVITDDLEKVVQFYERVTVVSVVRPAPVFAQLRLPSCTIAFGRVQTLQLFGNAAHAADNQTVIIEFPVDDVDKEFERLKTLVSAWVLERTTMPRGIAPCCLAIRTATSSTSSLQSPKKHQEVQRTLAGTGVGSRSVGRCRSTRVFPSVSGSCI